MQNIRSPEKSKNVCYTINVEIYVRKEKQYIIAFNKNLGEMSERLDRASDKLQKKIKSQSSGVFRDKINLQKTIDRNFEGNFGKKKLLVI